MIYAVGEKNSRYHTLLKKPSVTQDQNMWVTENSVIHIEGSEKSANNIDRAAKSIWMTEFSVTYRFWSCVTLGLSNNVLYDALTCLY
jgi:hypothetical protein